MADEKSGGSHPGMMGDGTEEQNLNQKGDPSARVTQKDAEQAFAEGSSGKQPGGSGNTSGDPSQVTKQVSNNLSDAKAAPQDKQPKDNSHNFN